MKTIFRTAILAVFLGLSSGTSNAELMLLKVDAPRACPPGLTVAAKRVDGMIQFDVAVDAESVAHADEIYKGRVKANAILKLANADQQLASVTVLGAIEGKLTRYQFSVAPSAAKSSELQLGVWLHEKDGTPTLGGGVSIVIQLGGFAANTEEQTKAK